MKEDTAIKRRPVLELELESTYQGKLVEFSQPDTELIYGRIQTLGLEWEGGDSFTITINLDGTRIQADYHHFIKTTRIL